MPPSEPASSPVTAAASPTFESAMERLEAIVEQMENARLPLEQLIRCYEEGTCLIKVCGERLSAAEQRIEIITRDAAGQPRAVEYSPAASPVAAPSARTPREAASAPESQQAPAGSSARPSKHQNEVSLF